MHIARKNAHAAAGNPERVRLMKGLSVPSAARFADHFFDWLYLDAMHDYEDVVNDLNAWWPKLRPGGLMSGDDYGDSVNTTFMSTLRFSSKFSTNAFNNKWGVHRAVQQFAASKKVTLQVTWANDCYREPAWYIIKPMAGA